MVDFDALKPVGGYVDLSLVTIFRKIRHRWYFLATSLVVCGFLSITYAVFATPVYQSSILLAPASGGSAASGVASRLLQGLGGAGSLFGGGAQLRNQREIAFSSLTSPYFTRAFIEEQNLRPILFAEDWNEKKGKWDVDDESDIPTLQEAYELFSTEIIKVEEQEFSSLVTVTVEWTDPFLAASWANSIVANVNSRLRQQAIDDANLTINYLNEELAKTNAVELQQSLYFLIDAEIQKKTVAKVQQEYAYRVLSPAVAADLDKYSKPRRVFIISVGLAIGLFFGLLICLVFDPITAAMKESRRAD